MAVAAAIYQLAMRDEMLPRFAKADMPPVPPPDQPGQPAAAPARAAGEAAKPATDKPAIPGNATPATEKVNSISMERAGKNPAHECWCKRVLLGA